MTKISTLLYTKCGTTINFACGGFQFGHCIRFLYMYLEWVSEWVQFVHVLGFVWCDYHNVCECVFTVFRNETWKKMCVDKWLMMDILMNCCLFCSINFIIHCRWWFFFFSSSLLVVTSNSILSHRQKRMPNFFFGSRKKRQRGVFDDMKLQLQMLLSLGFFSGYPSSYNLFSIYDLIWITKYAIFRMQKKFLNES